MSTISEEHPYNAAIMARPTSKRGPDFGARLATARRAAGLTQVQFAAKIGISQQMVDYYERRARNPTAEFVRRAAALLNVSADQLLDTHANGKAHRKPGPPPYLAQLTERLAKLPPAKQKVVTEILESVLARAS
jgi:transcriptional regulator with XRE-family HTH domain